MKSTRFFSVTATLKLAFLIFVVLFSLDCQNWKPHERCACPKGGPHSCRFQIPPYSADLSKTIFSRYSSNLNHTEDLANAQPYKHLGDQKSNNWHRNIVRKWLTTKYASLKRWFGPCLAAVMCPCEQGLFSNIIQQVSLRTVSQFISWCSVLFGKLQNCILIYIQSSTSQLPTCILHYMFWWNLYNWISFPGAAVKVCSEISVSWSLNVALTRKHNRLLWSWAGTDMFREQPTHGRSAGTPILPPLTIQSITSRWLLIGHSQGMLWHKPIRVLIAQWMVHPCCKVKHERKSNLSLNIKFHFSIRRHYPECRFIKTATSGDNYAPVMNDDQEHEDQRLSLNNNEGESIIQIWNREHGYPNNTNLKFRCGNFWDNLPASRVSFCKG